MKRFVNLAELLVRHVRIYLCRLNIGVSEHCLYTAQIRTVSQKIGRERVPDDMRGDFARNTRLDCVVFYNPFDTPRRQAHLVGVLGTRTELDEERIIHVRARFEIRLYGITRGRGHKYNTDFLSLCDHATQQAYLPRAPTTVVQVLPPK